MSFSYQINGETADESNSAIEPMHTALTNMKCNNPHHESFVQLNIITSRIASPRPVVNRGCCSKYVAQVERKLELMFR